ncbi:MAG TPA: DUF3592 domain-containing protein [Opitutaceae bacterium]|nr:DUF3592 domain-containing protein [Opitutaceae bacterium]
MNIPVGRMTVVFALFWSAIVLVFDGQFALTAFRQLRANSYTVAEGTVISSTVITSEDSDGPVYRPEVRYRYQVGERELVGDRLSYENLFASGADSANEAVAAFPAGAAIRVYFNPADPTDALLRPGLSARQLFLALFLTPFNAVMLFLWAAVAKWLWLKRTRPPAGGLRIESGLRGTSVRLGGMPALGAGLAAVAGVSFASIFVVGFASLGFRPSFPTITGVWILVLGGGLVATLWQAARNRSDRQRLLIDEVSGNVDLPPTHGRAQRVQIPASALTAVQLSRELVTDSDGDTHAKFALALKAKDRASERLALWADETQTRGFATWLANKLRVPLGED